MSEHYTRALQTACRLVSAAGIQDLSLERVARVMDVAPEELSRDFPTEFDLVRAALDFADGRATSHISSQIKTGSSLQRLTHLLCLYIDDAPEIREDWIFWSEIEARAAFDPSFRTLVQEETAWWIEMLSVLIEKAQAEGEITAELDAERAALRLILIQDSLAKHTTIGLVRVQEGRQEMLRAIEHELGVAVLTG